MTTQEVANRLTELCRQGNFEQAYDELYADNIVSQEPDGSQGPATVEGLENVKQKNKQFLDMVEAFHSNEVSEPVVAENYFAVSMKMDVTLKGMGRIPMEEVCVYEVKDGKITREQFFFTPQPQPANMN